MNELPVLVGLKVCTDVIVDKKTEHVTLVNCVRRWRVKRAPTPPQNFVVCCVLADGEGEIKFTLKVAQLSSPEPIFTRSWSVHMKRRLEESWLFIHLKRFVFPRPGRYEFLLLAGGEWFADKTITVIAEGESL